MKLIIFQGYNDSTFGCAGRDINVTGGGQVVCMRLSASSQPGWCLDISGQYFPGRDLKWVIGVDACDNERPVDWLLEGGTTASGSSKYLMVTVPDDATVELVGCDGAEALQIVADSPSREERTSDGGAGHPPLSQAFD